jgi:N-acetylglutamate synthase-like GNAT family acetyltransferase
MGLDWRRFVVAVDDRCRIVGCGQVKAHQGGVRELASLAVSRKWRRRGVGGRIIEHLMHTSAPPLWLMCRSGLVPYYLRFGFEEVMADEPQPTYFRRMRSLARALVFAGRKDHLAIMAWRGD